MLGCSERAQDDPKALSKTQTDTEQAPDVPPIADEERLVGVGQADLIGRTMPPYPQGLAEVQGVCVPGGPQPENICDFGIAVLGRENAEVEETGAYLVASRNATPDANQPSWVVTDALDTPVSPTGAELQLGGCRLDGEFRSDIVAVVAYDDNEYSTQIAWAKRLDIATGKFVEIELKRIDCLNPSYGV